MNSEDRLRRMIEAARDPGSGSGDWDGFVGKAHRALFIRRAALASGVVGLVAVAGFSASVLLRDPSPGPRPAPAVRPTETAEPTPSAPRTSPAASPTGPARSEIERFEAEVWLVADERLSFGTAMVPRPEAPADVSSRLPNGSPEQRVAVVLEALLAGPTSPDAEAGASSAIPEGTRLLDVRIDGEVAIADLSEEFGSGGGSLSMQLRVGQVVFTTTQVTGVEGVRIALDGEVVDSIGGEGVLVDRPMARSDFTDVSPPIVLTMPKIGSEVSSPLAIAGFANVFEANVNIRILDETGKPLVETFTTATCGSGCWGDFNEAVRFSVDREQVGRVEVLSYSAEDGSPQDVISIPVTLRP